MGTNRVLCRCFLNPSKMFTNPEGSQTIDFVLCVLMRSVRDQYIHIFSSNKRRDMEVIE